LAVAGELRGGHAQGGTGVGEAHESLSLFTPAAAIRLSFRRVRRTARWTISKSIC
jgi:hypothetical protein